MKIVLAIFCCLLLGFSITAQTETPNAEVAVEAVSLARDDGSGKPGEVTGKFLTTDTPIHCFIQLDSIKPATVKLILVAVKAAGLPPETKSIAVSYTTNGNQNQINFNAAPEKAWAAGSYRADIYVNGKLAVSRLFEIEISAKEIVPKKTPVPKPFIPRRIAKKPRRI